MEQLIKRVLSYEPTKNKWRSNYTSREFREASELNQKIFGIPLNRSVKCQCVEDLFFYLKRKDAKQLNIDIMSNENKRYVLKKDAVLMNHSFPTGLTRANATEHDCKHLLKINPKNEKHFEKLPENWKKEVADFDPKAARAEVKAAKAAAAAKTLDNMKAGELKEYAKTKLNYTVREKETEAIRAEVKAEAARQSSTEKTDEDKAKERYEARSARLVSLGYTREPGDDEAGHIFVKGDLSISDDEVYASTDDEFENLIPAE